MRKDGPVASGDTKFSHITVSADDDDDVVIQAGARPSGSGARAPEPREEPAAPEPAPVAPEPEPQEEPAPAAQPARDAKRYRETTAEDLEAEPMSAMQKAIIAVALAAVVGFVLYYLFFMR